MDNNNNNNNNNNNMDGGTHMFDSDDDKKSDYVYSSSSKDVVEKVANTQESLSPSKVTKRIQRNTHVADVEIYCVGFLNKKGDTETVRGERLNVLKNNINTDVVKMFKTTYKDFGVAYYFIRIVVKYFTIVLNNLVPTTDFDGKDGKWEKLYSDLLKEIDEKCPIPDDFPKLEKMRGDDMLIPEEELIYRLFRCVAFGKRIKLFEMAFYMMPLYFASKIGACSYGSLTSRNRQYVAETDKLFTAGQLGMKHVWQLQTCWRSDEDVKDNVEGSELKDVLNDENDSNSVSMAAMFYMEHDILHRNLYKLNIMPNRYVVGETLDENNYTEPEVQKAVNAMDQRLHICEWTFNMPRIQRGNEHWRAAFPDKKNRSNGSIITTYSLQGTVDKIIKLASERKWENIDGKPDWWRGNIKDSLKIVGEKTQYPTLDDICKYQLSEGTTLGAMLAQKDKDLKYLGFHLLSSGVFTPGGEYMAVNAKRKVGFRPLGGELDDASTEELLKRKAEIDKLLAAREERVEETIKKVESGNSSGGGKPPSTSNLLDISTLRF